VARATVLGLCPLGSFDDLTVLPARILGQESAERAIPFVLLGVGSVLAVALAVREDRDTDQFVARSIRLKEIASMKTLYPGGSFPVPLFEKLTYGGLLTRLEMQMKDASIHSSLSFLVWRSHRRLDRGA